ncbi:hypothetical protein [Arhodomonas sp. SL1]|uniref:hypothetical protein n=1 Tax=Arhodomonas sp. SL1 TaxID=3425691 RepID=UPI003F881043
MPATAEQATPRFAIVPLEGEARPSLWERVAPFVANVNPGDCLPDTIRELLEDDRVMVWAVIRDDGTTLGTCVTRIEAVPAGLALHVLTVAGRDMELWARQAMAMAQQEADEHDCQELRISAGPDAADFMADYGLHPWRVVYKQEVKK